MKKARKRHLAQRLTDVLDKFSRFGSDEERERLTREALADVDAGRVIDHLAAQDWADSLNTDKPQPEPR